MRAALGLEAPAPIHVRMFVRAELRIIMLMAILVGIVFDLFPA
jgi:hypothetical protein